MSGSDGDWRQLFGHPEPYPEQVDGIQTVRETADDGGYVCLEGACGTGKTMLALTAGLSLVRDPETDYERVLALTSVKQQLRQFEEDIRSINDSRPADAPAVTGLTLVGKADVCPYARENTARIDDRSVYDRCEGLRDRTRGLTGDDGPTTADALAADARRAQTGLADSGGDDSPFLTTAGEPTPYLPETAEHYGEGVDPTAGDASGTEYCPFYAQHLANTAGDGEGGAIPFDVDEQGMIDTETLVGLAAGHGTCPHSVMGAAATEAEVVVGNYYHAFDPTTAGAFTGALIDEETFVICDEAHMLEPRVRDLVSDAVADRTLRDAEREITRVLQPLAFDDDGGQVEGAVDAELVRGELAESDVKPDDLKRTRSFIRDLREELDRRVSEHLGRAHPGWEEDPSVLDDEELPLRKPDRPAEDAISNWAREAGYGDRVWARAPAVGAFVERVLDDVADDDRQWAAPSACRVLNQWAMLDHETYFREIELARTTDETEAGWRRVYNARLALHNCVPAEAIGARLAEFGGGVLMSATLAPMDVFREVTGLSYLADEGRPVVERTYPLSFPADNRTSFAVDAPKFTYDNRGPTVPPEENRTRQLHVDCVTDVIETTPGNVLVGAPNYREAAWFADVLADRVDRPVLADESSSDAATESLKAAFFDGPPKVLVTSTRGTLTEGVDYRGDRLAAAVVCGVPIISTGSPRTKAVQAAYDRTFQRDGFEVALTVPAVRKARQAIGRVIRSPDEVGVRVFVDARYARDSWNSVREFFPDTVREEFRTVSPDMLQFGLDQFWE